MFNDDDDFSSEDLNEYLNKFESFLKGESTSFFESDMLEMITDHYIFIGNYSKAIEAAEFGLECFPNNSLFILRIAQANSGKGLLNEALNLLMYKEDYNDCLLEFYLTKASIFSQLKNSDNAIKLYKQALLIADEQEKDEIYLDLSIEHQMKNDYLSAIEVLKKAIEFNPNNESAYYELAFCYDFSNQYDKAIKCFEEFLDNSPYSYTAWYNLGNIYTKIENYEEAFKAYGYCIAIEENFTPVYFNLGSVCLSLDKYEEAEKYLRKSIESEGEDAILLSYLGESLEQQDKTEEAKENYLKAISIDPKLAEAWIGLGIVSGLDEDNQVALHYFKKAVELEPSNDCYYGIIANAYRKIDDFAQAEDAFLKCLELNPNNEDFIKDYYSMLFFLSRWGDAAQLLKSYEKYETNQFTIKLLYVHWLWINNQESNAIDLLTKCIAEDSKKSEELLTWFNELNEEPIIKSLFI